MYKDSMELEIQKYLRGGGTLQELNQIYEIASNVQKDFGIVVLDYRTLADFSLPMVFESRGLILQLDTWDVVYKPIKGFYSLNQVKETTGDVDGYFDWPSTYAMEKLDGALVGMYYYKDDWQVSTRLSAIGDWLVWSVNSQPHSLSWREYVQKTLEDMGTSWDEFTSKLNKDIFYTFEIIGPENRVIVVYDKRELSLIGAVERESLQELDIYQLDFPAVKPKRTKVNNLQEAIDLSTKVKEAYLNEGVILIDKNFTRMKVINPDYAEANITFHAQEPIDTIKQMQINIQTLACDTTLRPKPQCFQNPTLFSAEYLNNLTEMVRFVQNTYFKEGNQEIIKTIWPEMYDSLQSGNSVSDAFGSMDGESILRAFAEYAAYKATLRREQEQSSTT